MAQHMTQDEIDRREEYRERNKALFTERARLQERIRNSHGTRRRGFEAKLRRVDAEVFEANRGLAVRQLRRWRGATRPADLEDLRSVADAALWEAVCTYDMEKGPFGQWAQLAIRRSLLRAVRSIDHQTLGRADFERRPRILAALASLVGTQAEGDLGAVAAEAGVPLAAVERVIGAARLTSLDSPVHSDDGSGMTVGDMCADISAPDPDEKLWYATGVDALRTYGLTQMDARESYVVTRAWGLDGKEPESLASLGEQLGVSREAARQVHNRALSRVLHPITLRKMVKHRAGATVSIAETV